MDSFFDDVRDRVNDDDGRRVPDRRRIKRAEPIVVLNVSFWKFQRRDLL